MTKMLELAGMNCKANVKKKFQKSKGKDGHNEWTDGESQKRNRLYFKEKEEEEEEKKEKEEEGEKDKKNQNEILELPSIISEMKMSLDGGRV